MRDQNNQIIVEHHISYEKRTDYIKGREICENDCSKLELCIISKNSYGTLNGWFDSQCKNLPNNLKNIQEKYSKFNDRMYVIMSLKNQINIQDMHISTKATSVHIFLDAKLFTVVLMNCFYTLKRTSIF